MRILEKLLSLIPRNRVYISGPMSGIDLVNRPAFIKAERELDKAGYKVISPAWFSDKSWVQCLTRDLLFMLLFCDRIATLPGWRKSRGATLEVGVGKDLSYPIHTVSYYCGRDI